MLVKYDATVGDDCHGQALVHLVGTAEVPDDVWARRQAGYRWSDEIEKLIIASLDDLDPRVQFDWDRVMFKNVDPVA